MKGLEWAVSTWHLIHYLGENMKDEFYINEKKEIFKIVKNICYNLPCPTCSEHAKRYLKKVDEKLINTRIKFRHFFFNFHNLLNIQLGKPKFDINKLGMYKKYNLGIVIKNFKLFYGKSYGDNLKLNLESSQLTRNNIVNKTVNWINKNREHIE
tara:strand:- start:9349 stop:9810 length:462 start_codon:yes stop_codon:yes gene_type:complete